MDNQTKEKIKGILTTLRDSCREGEDGTWDCSTDEGKEGFLYMSEDCEAIAKLLDINLKPYYNDNEND
jgi:hypothetical protein